MNKDLLKRVGMLTAATAACTAGVFGALAVNGLRYMRPTTDNWWLLPWVEPAARIEQSVMDFQDSSAPSYTITGYDAQNREIWSSTTFGRLTLVGSSRYVYTGNTEVQYNWGEGQPAVVWQYDEQGRLIREEIPGEAVTNFFYHGNETKPYLEKSYNGQNVQLLQKTTETDSSTGNTITLCMWYEEDGTFQMRVRFTEDAHGNTIKREVTDADGGTETYVNRWMYDDAARTATCVNGESGMIEKHWYDEQGRSIKDTWSNENGRQFETTTTYTDVTR